MSDWKQFTLVVRPGSQQTAMELANQDLRDVKKDHQSSRKIPFTRTDRVTLYLELADVYRSDGQTKQAGKVMQDAMAEFKGSPEEIRLAVANADLALDRCEQRIINLFLFGTKFFKSIHFERGIFAIHLVENLNLKRNILIAKRFIYGAFHISHRNDSNMWCC